MNLRKYLPRWLVSARPAASRRGKERRPRRSLLMESLESRDVFTVSNYIPQSYFVANSSAASSLSSAPPLETALEYLRDHASEFHLTAADLTNPVVTSQYTDSTTGTTYIYLRQTVNGLEVANAEMSIAVAASGRVISAGGGFVAGLAGRLAGPNAAVPETTALEAVNRAAASLALPLSTQPLYLSTFEGVERKSTIFRSGLSTDDITAKLHYIPTADGSAALAWQLIIRTTDGEHWYDLSVGDRSGEIVALNDWVEHASYNVVPLPANESPQDGGFSIVSNPENSTASPFGWHDTNGVAGAEFTDTRGNNVDAHLDRDANDVPDASPARPSGGAGLDFSSYTFDSSQSPLVLQNQNAAMVNLFYVINVLHDLHYQYGFTEAAGNFQTNNYGRGGTGSDAVQADAQDGSGTNNANFATPPDGSAPRMQQYIFTAANPDRDSDLDNGIIIHEYGHGVSNRLTGGPANSNALNATQSGGMGEGWSDFYALMFTQKASDTQNAGYGIGTYALNQAQTGVGIRRFRYSYDMAIDPLTFDAYGSSGTTSYGVARSTQVHNSGELWATTLWDMNWLLINKYGYDSDLYTGWTASAGPGHAGNKLALKLVMDGMKLQPANPSFIQARDAILAADTALTGGANHYEIWSAFARRGLGANASTSSSSSSIITLDFTIPPGVDHLSVTASNPANGGTVATPPTNFVLTISTAANAVTIQETDFTVNGIPATGYSYTPGSTTITFTFGTSPVTAEGTQTMQVASGAFNRASDNSPVDPFTAAFRYDSVPMQVTSTSPTVASTVILPLTTFDVNLNEPVLASSVAATDLSLSQGSATGYTLLNGDQTIRFTLTGLSTEGTLTASIPAGRLTDIHGNPNSAFSGNYILDIGAVALTGPAVSQSPLGSLAYELTASSTLAPASDTDSFTLYVSPGQSFSVLATPSIATLWPTITVRSPTNQLMGLVSAPAAGKKAIIDNMMVNTAGTYTIIVSSNGGTTSGGFGLRVLLNGAYEAEFNDGPSNGNSANAQSLNGSFINLSTSTSSATASRAAVLGGSDTLNTPDFYSFTATEGSRITLAATATSGSLASVELLASNGTTVLATAAGSLSNVSLALSNHPITASGTYYVRVTPVSDTTAYSLVVTRSAAFDLEPNDTAATAAPLTSSVGVLGALTAGATYQAAPVTYAFEDISTTGTSALSAVDDSTATLSSAQLAGFSFNYFDTTYNSLSFSSNGLITFGGSDSTYTNTDLTSSPFLAAIAAFWDDLLISGTTDSAVYWQVLGSGTDQRLVIQWNNIRYYANSSSTDLITFQAVLSENGNSIRLNYADLVSGSAASDNGRSATVGIKDAGTQGTSRLLLAQDNGPNTYVGSGKSVLIEPATGADWYSITLGASQTGLQVETTTPGNFTGYTNSLNPAIALFDQSGNAVPFSLATLADGRNERMTATGLTAGATYKVRIMAEAGTTGEYFTSATPVTVPTVTAVQLNAGNADTVQRSQVKSLTVTFNTAVNLAAGAFSITGNTPLGSPAGNVTVSVATSLVSGQTVANLTFSGPGTENGSLRDGAWVLSANGAAVTVSGVPMAASYSSRTSGVGIIRLFGDSTGDGFVDSTDFGQFTTALGRLQSDLAYKAAFDWNTDGFIDSTDFGEFTSRLGLSVFPDISFAAPEEPAKLAEETTLLGVAVDTVATEFAPIDIGQWQTFTEGGKTQTPVTPAASPPVTASVPQASGAHASSRAATPVSAIPTASSAVEQKDGKAGATTKSGTGKKTTQYLAPENATPSAVDLSSPTPRRGRRGLFGH